MSIISESFQSASIEAQSLLGEAFSISGNQYVGVFSTKEETVTQEDVGYMTVTRFSCVATKSQFGSAPTENDRLVYQSINYIIENVTTTALHYKMELVRQTI